MTLGDWGGASISAQDKQNVYAVASQMATTAEAIDPAFIINTGDNFYWCGIQNTSDFQITTDYYLPYAASSLDVPWYSVLGNHEYGYNVTAQVDLTNADTMKRWYMPARYWTKRIALSTSKSMTIVALDTNPCVTEYRDDNQSGWDPCGEGITAGCSIISDKTDPFEGPCLFHQNIVSQNCGDQFTWFKTTLAAVPKDDWLIVMGHHPMDEIDVEDFTTVLQDHGFDIYFNGHAHTLSQYTLDGQGAYVTSGAGSMVNTPDQGEVGHSRTPGFERTALKVDGQNISADSQKYQHSYKTVFNSRTAGYTLSTFSSDFSSITTEYLSYTGSCLHQFTVQKNEVITV